MNRRAWSVFVVVLCSLLVAPAGAAGPGWPREARDVAPLDDPKVREGLERQGREQRERLEERRGRLQERQERRASRTRFGTLSDEESVALLRERKTPLQKLGAYRVADLDGVRKLERFVGDNAAKVTLDSGEGSVLVSPVPLRTENREGKVAPVDLSLFETESGFSVENALVSARLPRSLDEALVLPDDGLAVTVGSQRREARGERVGGSVVYPNVDADLDALLTPITGGVELSWLVRSARAGEVMRFSIEPSRAGEKVELVKGEKDAAITVVRDGKPTAFLLPPVAGDMDGVGVPVSMEVDGSEVTVRLQHRSADAKYPILVDPPLIDMRGWIAGDQNYASFAYGTNRANYFSPVMSPVPLVSGWGAGLYIGAYQGLAYNAWDYGQWVIGAPRESFVARTDWIYSRHQPDGSQFVGGIWDARNSRWEPSLSSGYSGSSASGPFAGTGAMYGGTVTTCAVAGCNPDYGHEGNFAVAALQITSSHTLAQPALINVGAAHIYMNDRNNPSIVTTGGYIPSGWISSGTLHTGVTLSDPGMGPADVYFRYDGDDVDYVDSGCFGHACSTDLSETVSVDSADLPEGPGTLDVSGFDWVSRESNKISFPIKIDRSAPEIDPYGPLVDREDGWLDESSFVFWPNATDGDAADPRSGVQRLKVTVGGPNGESPSTVIDDQTACGDNCAKNPEVTINADSYSVGEHRIRVEATDAIGHLEATNFQVKIPPGRMPSPSTGQRFSRLIPLHAETTRAGLTGVTFEFRRNSAANWTTIPAGKIKRPNNTTLSGWPAPLTSGSTEVLIWDARTTTGIDDIDGQIQIRPVFTGTANTGDARPATVTLDRSFLGSTYATEEVGPGLVTLASGNYAFSADDVSIEAPASDLTVSRTYNSRNASNTPVGPLGPGWTLGTPITSAGVEYTGLTVAADESVIIRQQDGTEIPFAANGSSFSAPVGFKRLRLRKDTSPTIYVLTDDAGTETRFTSPAGTAEFAPTAVSLAADRAKTSWSFEVHAGVLRPTRAIAPAPAGVTCTSPPFAAGCRVLDFIYATATTATGQSPANWGNYAGRLIRVEFTGAGGTATSTTTDTVAEYRYDDTGRLRSQWDPRISPALKDTYDYTGNLLTGYTPPGETGWAFEYGTVSGDANPGRVKKVKRLTSPNRIWTVAYQVPVSGSGAPYNMSEAAVGAWGQSDLPADATAVFPPTQVPADPPTSYTDATVHYLNANALEVNTAQPGGKIITREYDHHRNVVRELSAKNRDTALATGSSSAAKARELDTQRSYDSTGERLLSILEPAHDVQAASGTASNRARRKTVHEYDQGAPSAGRPYNVITRTSTGATPVAGGAMTETRVTTQSYDGQDNLGWQLRQPTAVTVDPGGLNLTTRTKYDPDTATVIESRQPSDAAADTAGTVRTTLYSAGPAELGGCSNLPAQAGMPCHIGHPHAPATSSTPPLMAESFAYDRLGLPTRHFEIAGSTTRTTDYTYDAAGRKITEVTTGTSSAGTGLPGLTFGYDSATGRPTTTATSTATVTRAYNALGLLSSYTDATGQTTTYSYDEKDRLTSVSDGKGLRTQGYDANDNVISVTDSQLPGAVAGAYDADNELIFQALPNARLQTIVRNELGHPWWIAWEKTNCTSDCIVAATGLTRSIHDQARMTLDSDTLHLAYDQAGRLSTVWDITPSNQCTTRQYLYDANSNRTALKTWAPLSGGACDFSGGTPTTNTTYTHDTADRLTNTGVTYDPFARTTQLPAALAGGQQLDATYYVNDLVRSLTQNGTTYTYELDPERRFQSRGTTGTQTNHYGDDTDNPTWTATNPSGTQYTRNIAGVDGNLAAIYNSQTGTAEMQYADIHGDIIVTASSNPGASGNGFTNIYNYDEFGAPKTAVPRYGWLGGGERSTETQTGTSLMGVRIYQPQLGRFLQKDPVRGGSANAYDYANQDPLNQLDLDGRAAWVAIPVGIGLRELGKRAGRKWGSKIISKLAAHKKNARPSTKGKHEKGQARANQKHTDKKRNKPNWIPRNKK